MDPITSSYIKSFSASQQINKSSESELFEYFSAYAAVGQLYKEEYNITDILTGGGNDCGIDALAIIVNGVLVTTKEEIFDLIEINKKLTDVLFVFVQSKTSSNFDCKELRAFGAGVRDFLSEEPKMQQNELIKAKREIVQYIFENATIIKNKPVCYMYYVTTGKWIDDKNCTAAISDASNDLEQLNIFDSIKYIPVDAKILQKYYQRTISPVETQIAFEHKVNLPEIPDVKQSYLGYLDYEEYHKLIVDENGDIRKSIFYDNVRDYLGENVVNSEISDTIAEEPDKFILFNNGVTIICKELSNIANRFTLVDYQIVNGCQTSHVLFNNKDAIDSNLQVPVKVIETDDDLTVNKIIKATNRQTEVKNEQLIALNDFNRRLEEYYAAIDKEERLYYERRSKQYANNAQIEKVRIVSISTQIKAMASMFYDKPDLASRYYGRIMRSIDDLFDDSHMELPYYTSTYALYKFEYLFRNKALDQQYKKFKYYIIMMLKYKILGKNVGKLSNKSIERDCNKILKVLNDNNEVVDVANNIFEVIGKNVENITDADITKSAALRDKLKEEILLQK